MSIILKPCPFCGSTEQHGTDFCICGSETALQMSRGAWNTRPIEDALQAENKRLTAEVTRLVAERAAVVQWQADAEKACKALRIEIEEMKAANRWIPVEERLPEKGVMVFAYNRNRGSYAFARYKGDYWEAVESSNHWMMAVTHWRPILPPKEGEK